MRRRRNRASVVTQPVNGPPQQSQVDALEQSGERQFSSEAPTLRPAQLVAVQRIRLGAPVDEILYRFSVGDLTGALAAAESLLDGRCVPVVIVSEVLISAMRLEHEEQFVLPFVDGHSSLEDILRASGLPMLDSLRAISVLLEKNVISLR
jgi:hypothetical protein